MDISVEKIQAAIPAFSAKRYEPEVWYGCPLSI